MKWPSYTTQFIIIPEGSWPFFIHWCANTALKSVPFLLQKFRKKHTLSVAFLVKNAPQMLAHSRYLIYKEYPPPPRIIIFWLNEAAL